MRKMRENRDSMENLITVESKNIKHKIAGRKMKAR